MRNRYPGTCYRCNEWVAAGDGHFEKFKGQWRVQHASCAIQNRGKPDKARIEHMRTKLESKASGTGRIAQKARARLRKEFQ